MGLHEINLVEDTALKQSALRVARLRDRLYWVVSTILWFPVVVAAAFPLSAQRPPTARIEGRVVEARVDRPIEGALVRLDGSERVARSDEDGRFSFENVQLGAYVLSIEHSPFQPVQDSLRLNEEDATYIARILLFEEPIALPPISVTVRGAGTVLTDTWERVERMRRLGTGDFFDRDEIAASGTSRVSYLIARLPGVRMRPVAGRVGAAELRLHPRNDCPPSIYLDGRQMRGTGEVVDDFISLPDVEIVEVYRRMSSLPLEFSDVNSQYCGAVAVWTRRGTDALEPFGWRRLLTATGFAGLAWMVIRVAF
jgi:hypothetical protein